LTVEGSKFLNLTATLGAGVTLTLSNARFDSCLFSHNFQTTFDVATVAFGGAAFAALNSQFFITNCTFDHNRAVDGGGALRALDGSRGVIELTNFFNNSAVGFSVGGGAASVHGFASVDFRNCYFWNNFGESGGALFLASSVPLKVASSTFSGNSAGVGGGVYVMVGSVEMTG
jgi:hypothetical protein